MLFHALEAESPECKAQLDFSRLAVTYFVLTLGRYLCTCSWGKTRLRASLTLFYFLVVDFYCKWPMCVSVVYCFGFWRSLDNRANLKTKLQPTHRNAHPYTLQLRKRGRLQLEIPVKPCVSAVHNRKQFVYDKSNGFTLQVGDTWIAIHGPVTGTAHVIALSCSEKPDLFFCLVQSGSQSKQFRVVRSRANGLTDGVRHPFPSSRHEGFFSFLFFFFLVIAT